VVCQPNYPVKRAFRTAGIVRGKHPYALVADDIQKDDAVHHYDWILTLLADLQIAKIEHPVKDDAATFDVLLTGDPAVTLKKDESLPPMRAGGPIKAGQPMLLVRVLSRTSQAGDDKPPALIDEIKEKRNTIRRLVLPADTVAPDYKVLLYAFKEGDPLPKTTWDKAHGELTVVLSDQQDTVRFRSLPDGRTGLHIRRAPAGGEPEQAFALPTQ